MKVRRGGSPSSWRTYQLYIYWFPASVRLARCPRASDADRRSRAQPRGRLRPRSRSACDGAGGGAVHSAWPQRSPNHGGIIWNYNPRRIAVQPVVREEFSIMKYGINMLLIGDLWIRARTTAPPPAQQQRGSEAADGPEAAPWTGDRRR